VDDRDLGDQIIYTGRGGRDPASGRQIADQTFDGQNQALVTSCLQGLPVRLVRGAGTHSPRVNERPRLLDEFDQTTLETQPLALERISCVALGADLADQLDKSRGLGHAAI
jgi:hypothetical protein